MPSAIGCPNSMGIGDTSSACSANAGSINWPSLPHSSGVNPSAAVYAGIDVGRAKFIAFCISGMVAGLCGLIWSRNSLLTPQQVEDILRSSCDDLGALGLDDTFGYGRINSYEALLLTPPPTVAISFPNGRPAEVDPAGGTTLSVVSPGSHTWTQPSGFRGQASSQRLSPCAAPVPMRATYDGSCPCR